MKMNRIRITVVGDGDTGKTCMLMVYKDKKYEELYIPTVFDSYSMNITIKDKEYVVILSDTAGQEEYDKLRTLAYRDTDVFILCYAINNKDSYDNVALKWYPELKHFNPSARIILVGTKSDLRQLQQSESMKSVDGDILRRTIKADNFVECSSKFNYNIEAVFQEALLTYVQKNEKSTEARPCCTIL